MDKKQRFFIDKVLKVSVVYLPIKASLRRTWSNLSVLKRASTGVFALLIVFSVFWPVYGLINDDRRYNLNSQTKQLVGEATAENLAKFITTDQETGDLIFKKELLNQSQSNASGEIKQQGGNYSVTIHKDTKKGISYYDPSNSQSFSIKPQFDLMAPQQTDGHIVMPLSRGSGQQVVTLKGNGIKEDIILNKYQGNEKKFTYNLDLPASMEARLTDNGEVEIYTGSDTGLFGTQISYGSDKDRQLVEAAQKKAKKDKLVFVIPAPIIRQANGSDLPPETQSKFSLKDNILTVESSGLKNLQYPITIDPSVIVTSSNDFDLGMDGGDVNVNNGQIERVAPTGGAISTTPNASTYSVSRTMAVVAAYNNRLYVMGGCSSINGSFQCGGVTTDVRVGDIGVNGQVTWQSHLNSDDLTLGVYATQATIYNGYIYIAGGVTGTGAAPATTNAVYYAQINSSNGRLNGWNLSANSLPVAGLSANGTVAYGGYLYTTAGCLGLGVSSGAMACGAGAGGLPNLDIYSARIMPGGAIDSWNDVGNIQNIGFLPNHRYTSQVFIYNGILYVSSVFYNGSTTGSILQSFSIGADGSLTAFDNSQALNSTARYSHARSGYIYSSGGAYVLPSTGKFSQTTAAVGAASCINAVSYKNYVYCTGNNSGAFASVSNSTTVGSYASPGYLSTFGADQSVSGSLNSAGSNVAAARVNTCAVAYDSYLYLVGGSSGGGSMNFGTGVYYDGVKSTALAATGGLGSWTSSTTFFANIGGNPSFRSALMCEVYKGQLYIMGGRNSTTNYADIQVASVSKGVVGTFTVATGKLSTGKVYGSSAIKRNSNDGNVYLYAFGGGDNKIEYGKIEYTEVSYSAGSRTSNQVTLTVGAGHGIVAGNRISVTAGNGVNDDSSYNITDVTVTSVTATSITYAQTAADDVSAGTGTIVKSDVCGWTGSAWDCTSGAGGQDIRPSSIDMPDCPILVNWTILSRQSTVVNKDTVYMIGGRGFNSSQGTEVNVNCTWRASINTSGSNGDIGGWTRGSDMTTLRQNHTAVVWNGYIYTLGGTSGASNLNTVEKAGIGSSGALSSWQTEANTHDIYIHHSSSVAYNGYLYTLAGIRPGTATSTSTTPSNSTSSAYINNGGSGVNSALTYDSQVLPKRRYNHASFAYKGYLYVAGGIYCTNDLPDPINTICPNNDITGTVYKAPIDRGDIGSWSLVNSLATPRWGAKMFGYNDKLYIAGGCGINSVAACNGADILDSVEKADVLSSGNLSSWTTAGGAGADIGAGRIRFGLTQYNGYVYMAGGCTSLGFGFCNGFTTVQYSAIDSSGNLGAWTPGTSFSGARSSNFITAYNGYLYVGGGAIVGTETYDDIQYAQIGSLGSVGSWTTDPNRLSKNYFADTAWDAYAENGFLHVFGIRTFQSAPIGSTGALNGAWNVSNNFASTGGFGFSGFGLAYYKGYGYLTGGLSFVSPQDWAASFYTYTMPRVATYERWIDTDLDTTPINIIFNGSDTGNTNGYGGAIPGLGGIQIYHKDIQAAGTSWGAAAYLDPGIGSNLGRIFDYTVSENMARGYLINITLDDTQTFTFWPSGSSGNNTAITDFSFYYHAASARRLRHGGTFTGEVKQSLDAYPR